MPVQPRLRSVGVFSLVLVLVLFCAPCFAGGDYSEFAQGMPPITVVRDGQERTISLTDGYDFHGNACAGATMAFQAVRYGLQLLFGADTPDLDDLVIFSAPPAPLEE